MSAQPQFETTDRPTGARPIAAFRNAYALLPERFFARVAPTSVAAPRLVRLNTALAAELGLEVDVIEALGAAEIFSGRLVPEGADPLAMAYAGHQFGHFVPQLGDGRAILMGEVVDRNGARRDLQWKGSGRTPFSRGGDGRAALGPALREYLVSEAMHALGIPTTRALAVVTTGDLVYRDAALPGAVLTRVAASHIRVGTFQYFAARRDDEAIKTLADYAIDRHYPEARAAERPYLAFLEGVIERQASLIARWMGVGFIHGVMNTDNMTISGETIDFGPCAFMDAYDPATVFSSIDHQGRYAFGQQPRIAQWNLARLAETLLPLLDEDLDRGVEIATEAVNGFGDRFQQHWLTTFRAKTGLLSEREEDPELIREWMQLLQANEVDFTIAFRRLGDESDAALRGLFTDLVAYDDWAARRRARLALDGMDGAERRASMNRVNPAVIPRNHRVEAMIEAAVERQDFSLFEEMNEVLATPFEERPEHEAYRAPPPPSEQPYRTFCGT